MAFLRLCLGAASLVLRRGAADIVGLFELAPALRRTYRLSEPVLISSGFAAGLEGVVAKRLDSTYQPGVRSPAWVKVKFSKARSL
jgi:bifunctional non-homologous end joining protein LigD